MYRLYINVILLVLLMHSNCGVNGQFKIIGLIDGDELMSHNQTAYDGPPINNEPSVTRHQEEARELRRSDSTTSTTATAMNLIKIHIMNDLVLKENKLEQEWISPDDKEFSEAPNVQPPSYSSQYIILKQHFL